MEHFHRRKQWSFDLFSPCVLVYGRCRMSSIENLSNLKFSTANRMDLFVRIAMLCFEFRLCFIDDSKRDFCFNEYNSACAHHASFGCDFGFDFIDCCFNCI